MLARPVIAIAWVVWLGLFCAGAATAGPKRVALVVGNAAYADKPLANPANDATDMAAALRRLGFEVLERTNRNPQQMREDLADFQDRLAQGDVGLFYFAGHGVQTGRGLNYLLPVGVSYRRERDAELHGLEAGAVLRRMEESGASLSLVILDACRDSPLPPESRSAGARGLGRMDAPSGSLIAFATAPGRTANDNSRGRNGLYTAALLRHLETPGLRLEDVFLRVRVDVERATNRLQSPEEVSKLTTAFYLRPATTANAAASATSPSATNSPSPAPTVSAPPAAGALDLADLQRQQQQRQEWQGWQTRMKQDFDRVAAAGLGADLQVLAWERFLQMWKDDNPVSSEDEGLRLQAQQRLTEARRSVTPAAATPSSLAAVAPAAGTRVRLATSAGDIVIALDPAKAPRTVDNFLGYVRAGHYDGTVFHRVIDSFMIQGGGYRPDLSEKPTRAPIPLEANNGLSNVRGTVAAARASSPNSATAQFFINVVDNPRLDSVGGGYAVFGRVIEGMEAVDRIRAVPTQLSGMHQNVPVTPVIIRSASVE
jgi:peptidyl-prolyl cis-trans isomerase A (cyclophilin A)